MSDRDAWARLTPYEVGIPGREYADENFAAIAREAAARGVDASDPGAFLMLGEAGRVLRELQSEEGRGGEMFQRFGAFLFHAYHFHREGERLILLETALARYLVEGSPGAGAWAGELPQGAGYLQLPRHLFWSRPDEDETPEPMDGVFWARSTGDTLSVLVALGVRRDRPGLSVVALPPVPLADAPAWVREPARAEGEDFRTTLPGGELDRLYSIETLGEALKLTARALAYLHAVPEGLGEEERSPAPAEVRGEGQGGPLPSRLPFRRLRLRGR